MQTITTISLDIAKSVFQVHGVDAEGNVVLRRQLKRRYVLAFFQKLPCPFPKIISARSDDAVHPRPAAATTVPDRWICSMQRRILVQ